MRRGRLIACVLALVPLGTARADTILTFDDLVWDTSSQPVINLPSGYGGFSWHSWTLAYSDSDFFGRLGNTYGFPSPHNAITSSGGVPVWLEATQPFTFTGAYFAPITFHDQMYDNSSTTITVKGYLGGSLVGTVTKDLSPGFGWLQAGFDQVDRLEFSSSADWNKYWLMDNFNAPVPEPASLLLLGTGLVGLRGWRKRRQ